MPPPTDPTLLPPAELQRTLSSCIPSTGRIATGGPDGGLAGLQPFSAAPWLSSTDACHASNRANIALAVDLFLAKFSGHADGER